MSIDKCLRRYTDDAGQCPLQFGQTGFKRQGCVMDRNHTGEKTHAEKSQEEETWLTLISLAILVSGILRVKAVTRLRNRLYGIPIQAMEIGWKRKWLETKESKAVA